MIVSSKLLDIPIQLIGITGKAGVGKDTVANYIHDTYVNCWIEAFADPLKASCAELFGISSEDFYDRDLKELDHPIWKVSPRKIAQFFGTEIIREQMWKLLSADSQDFWVRSMQARLSGNLSYMPRYSAIDTVIIPDVRFQNEYDWIIGNGGIIISLTRSDAPDNIGIPGHKSESGIILNVGDEYYEIVNSETIEDLNQVIDSVLLISRLKFKTK